MALIGAWLASQPDVLPNAWVLLGGVAVAAMAIFANAWIGWRSAAVAHALDTLQTLRTDREYLINAYVVRNRAMPLGRALSSDQLAAFWDDSGKSSIDNPSFFDASRFLLNQYEFLAAGVRSGAIDYLIVRQTLRGTIIAIVNTYAAPIRKMRIENPRVFEHLLWLYRRMRDMPPYDRGPFG
ncbi:MAG: DUF4760 domain-containing protein [Vannielia sp.]|uniref:DUF4760 domain-containing protein n=1 Tax=Vannielia sp. TaxID=2813045 RepID=UPI003B8C7BFE